MTERKSLIEGMKSATAVDPALEKEFVYRAPGQARPPAPAAAAETREGNGHTLNATGRVPLTTRIRADYAAALKRASLERQLSGVKPNSLQDILEDALHPWLRSNGYLN